MRVAMVGRYYNRQGGVSRVLAELSDRAAARHDVTVFSHEILDREDSRAEFRQVGMLTRPTRLQTQSFALALRRHMRGLQFDVVHVHDCQGLDADLYTAHSCYRAYIALRRREGGPEALLSRVYPPHVLELAFERYCYARSSAPIIAVSSNVKAELEEHLGVEQDRIRVIPNGVDTRAFVPAASPLEARRELRAVVGDVPDDAVVLLFAGYEFHRKGLATIVKAMARSGDHRWVLWVAGRDKPDRYRTLAERLGLGGRVLFLGHQPDMKPLFQAADAFVFPSIYEAFPLVLLESLACGTPLIASLATGIGEFLTDGREGFLLERATDADELAAALTRLCAERELWPELRASARRLGERFDWDEIWARTEAVYEELAH